MATICSGALLAGSGCLPLADGRRMEAEIAALRAELAQQREADQKGVAHQLAVVDDQLDHATLLFERNQAELGLSVERLSGQMGRLEGRVEEVAQAQSAITQKAQTERAAADARLQQLAAAVAAAREGAESPDAMFADGERHLAAQEWKDARRLFEEFLARWKSDPRAARAQFLVGETLAAEKAWPAAVAAYAKVVDNYRDSDLEEQAMVQCAVAFLAVGHCDDAAVWLKELVRRHPKARSRKDVRDLQVRIGRDKSNKTVCSS